MVRQRTIQFTKDRLCKESHDQIGASQNLELLDDCVYVTSIALEPTDLKPCRLDDRKRNLLLQTILRSAVDVRFLIARRVHACPICELSATEYKDKYNFSANESAIIGGSYRIFIVTRQRNIYDIPVVSYHLIRDHGLCFEDNVMDDMSA